MTKNKGWHREKYRHGLASRGIKTVKTTNPDATLNIFEGRRKFWFVTDNYGIVDEGKEYIYPTTLNGFKSVSEGDYQPISEQKFGGEFVDILSEMYPTVSTERSHRQTLTAVSIDGKKVVLWSELGGPYWAVFPKKDWTPSQIASLVRKLGHEFRSGD